MPLRNPSELARLEDELEYHRSKVLNLALSKGTREAHLAEVRKLERWLKMDGEE